MHFTINLNDCKTALATLATLASIIFALLGAAVVGIDARVSAAQEPVKQSVVRIEVRQSALENAVRVLREDLQRDIANLKQETREDVHRVEVGVNDGIKTLDGKIDWITNRMFEQQRR